MHRRKWDADLKVKIIIQGLQGRSVAELCNESQISQSRYYQWRDQLLANASQTFEVPQYDRTAARLARENARRKALVGELTLELKKATSCWADAAAVAPGDAA
jgi:transposase-like protein